MLSGKDSGSAENEQSSTSKKISDLGITGTVPESPNVSCTSSCFKPSIPTNSEGKVPVSPLPYKNRLCRWSSCPISIGIVPVMRRLLKMEIVWRNCNSPSWLGRGATEQWITADFQFLSNLEVPQLGRNGATQ